MATGSESEPLWSKSVGIVCPSCATEFIVLPPTVSKAVGDLFGAESELEFLTDTGKATTGAPLTVADGERRYTCPACGEAGRLPPPEEIFTE